MKSFTTNSQSRKPVIAVAVLAACLILLLAIAGYRAFFHPLAETVTIANLKVGGMTPAKAQQLLKQELEETLYRQPLSVQLPEETLVFSPEECGLEVHTGKLLWDALHGTSTELSLRSYLEADVTAIRSKLEDYAHRHNTELSPAAWHLDGKAPDLSTDKFEPSASGQTLVITTGTPSLHLDVDGVLEDIMQAFSEATTLCKEERYQVIPEVLPEALPEMPDAAAIVREYTTAAVNDTVDRETYEFLYGSYGTTLDEALLKKELAQADYGASISIPLQYQPPEILGQNAYFQDILGAYETRHTNDKNRNTNLQIQCDALNGLVLQPGEVFSMNGTLGERTAEKGYLPAPAYSGNRLVNDLGGGVCQGTTTLYNCVLLADLEVVFRACHGVKVGYVPLGLDAAVNFLTTDFQFRNNFHFPIQLKAWLEDEYVKMQILGTDEKDYYIKMETGSGEDEYAYYARSYKCKYDKETDQLISRDIETFSTYYKSYE